MNVFILSASLLFGLIHPGSKFVLGLGIPLVEFCLLYIGIRFLVQIPIFITNINKDRLRKCPWPTLVVFGVVGALLQVSEFFGLSRGLPVATVTFLVYSHPIWSLFLSTFINKEKIGKNEILRAIVGIIGIYIVSNQSLVTGQSLFDITILAPISAGFLIALWSSLSNKLSKGGLFSSEISFFYDFFAFVSLLIYAEASSSISAHFLEIADWMQVPFHAFVMITYSIAFGLLPNYLFYKGSQTSTNLNASLLLLIEPVIATLVAFLFFEESISHLFLLGALLILTSGLNLFEIKSFSQIKKAKFYG